MLLVGDKVNMPYEGRNINGTVTVIHENNEGNMTYWIDSDDGENCLIFDDSEVTVTNTNYMLDFC